MRNRLIPLLLLLSACAAPDAETAPPAGEAPAAASPPTATPVEPLAGETRLANMVQLTQGGSNSEAYFSQDGEQIIFQATRPGVSECDQIFTMNVDGSDLKMVSTGAGRTTCGFFFPGEDRILFSSTHHVQQECPAPPDRSRGYVWPLLPYDVFTSNPDGSDLRRITEGEGYDAEATISPDGSTIVFTSHRDGDVDLYLMNADGTNVRRITDEVGYDGGAFFSADGSRIVYRAHHPTDPAEIEEFRQLLAEGIVRPDQVEIFVMNADGSGKQQLTDNGKANFAPYFHPNGRQIIFSSNVHDPSGRSFALYLLDIESGEVERVTQNQGFDSFPMFNQDGTKLIFASDRGAASPGEFNLFIADWVEPAN